MKAIVATACLLRLAAGLAFAMALDSTPAQQEIDRFMTAWHQAAGGNGSSSPPQ